MTRDTATLVQALAQSHRIGKILGLYDDFKVERTYAGRLQRADSAHSFTLMGHSPDTSDYHEIIGSMWTLAECARAAREGRLEVRLAHWSNHTCELWVCDEPNRHTLPPISPRGAR